MANACASHGSRNTGPSASHGMLGTACRARRAAAGSMEEVMAPSPCPGRGAARSAAPLIRDPGCLQYEETGVPGLQRTAAPCAAPGTRELLDDATLDRLKVRLERV